VPEVQVTVQHQPEHDRYDALVEQQPAGRTVYRPQDCATWAFVHTEVDDDYAHHGVATQLIGGALDDVRSKGIKVLPDCPFVQAFIAEHEDYVDLVPVAQRSRYGV